MNKRQYFGTDGIRGRVGKNPITPDFVLKLGFAAGRVLAAHNGHQTVLIGKDTRISGYMFESALEAGLVAAGVDIQLLGPLPTPAIAYLIRALRASAGIVISASHNPFYDNGIKFFGSDGMKLSDAFELEIEAQLEKPIQTVDSEKLGKANRLIDAAGRYIEFCKSTVPNTLSLSGMKIVLDCAHGAAYHVAPAVFRELGAEVLSLSVDPDGFNINEACGATSTATLQKIVLAEEADLGIALDGDGDRCMMVDAEGALVDGDDILWMIERYLASKGQFQGGVVGTLMTNLGLELAFKKSGVPFVRTAVGDRYVIEELLKQKWVLGGETSGHIICLNMTTTGDGIIAALQVLAAMQTTKKSLKTLKSGYQKFPQVLLNVKTERKVDVTACAALQKEIKKAESEMGQEGRVVLRASGTEPLIRVMVEYSEQAKAKSIAETLVACVEKECV